MTDQSERPTSSKVATEGSARVLNEVKGRLENIDAGELPIIEKVARDGSTRRVDPTGEMIKPDAAQMAAVSAAAEAFSSEHLAGATPEPVSSDSPESEGKRGDGSEPTRTVAHAPLGFWARVKAWFTRS